MSSETTMVAEQCRLQEWAAQATQKAKEAGIISEEEFNQKKMALLEKL